MKDKGVNMEDLIVRLQQIKLTNFKNVGNGIIKLPFYHKNKVVLNKAEVIGLYGQNGSGKTTLIDAMEVIQQLFSGQTLSFDENNKEYYIKQGEEFAKISCLFYIKNSKYDDDILVEYDVKLTFKNNKYIIDTEKISCKKYTVPNANSINFEYNSHFDESNSQIKNPEDFIIPKVRVEELCKDNNSNKLQLMYSRIISLNNSCSFFFNPNSENCFKQSVDFSKKDSERKSDTFIKILKYLNFFSKMNLIIVKNTQISLIGANVMLPIMVRTNINSENSLSMTCGNLSLNLQGVSYLSSNEYDLVKNILHQMNIVLSKIIPKLSLELENEPMGELNKDGERRYAVTIIAIRENSSKMSLKYESDGIKKIIAILSTLIAVYNYSNVCLLVDELDAGIFEYLLGELIQIIDESGKGQFIFTSHNLRPLEVLSHNQIIFTTINSNDRYTRLDNIKPNNNLRDTYYRNIFLGGPNEDICVYEQTEPSDIRLAFKKAVCNK